MRMTIPGRSLRLGLLLWTAAMLAACSEAPPSDGAAATQNEASSNRSVNKPTQVAARVNTEELTVHQLNDRLAAWGSGADRSRTDDPELGRALNTLIELTLLRQEAEAQGLASKPEVLRQLQAARAEVLARALAQQIGEEEPPPAPHVVRRWYDEHPQSYAKRRVFHLQELRVTPSPQAATPVLQRLGEFRQAQSMARALEQQGGSPRSVISVLQVASDQLPEAQLQRLQRLSPGQALQVEDAQGLRVWWLQAAVEQPVDWEQAQPAIERLLAGRTRAERLRRELERLRAQSQIEFMGDYSRWAPAAASESEGSAEPAQARLPSANAR